jgi:hypothetical protein
VYKTNDSDLHQIKKVVLKSAIIPNTMYNINKHNNRLHLPNTLESDTDYTIPEGQYTTQSLITALEAILPSMVITQDELTQKLTFTMTGGQFSVFSDKGVNPMCDVLGMLTATSSMVGVYTCEALPDLAGLNNIYISSQTLSNHSAMIASEKLKKDIFCNIPMDVPFGVTKVSDEDETSLDYSVFSSRKNISSIDITLLDENNNELDLQGADWIIILRVYL